MPKAPTARSLVAARVLSLVVLGLLAAGLVLVAGPAEAAQAQRPSVPGELLIGFHAGVSSGQAQAVYGPLGAVKLEEIRQINVHRVRVPAAALEAVERALARHPEVKFVERNHLAAPEGEAQPALPDELLVGFDPSVEGQRAESSYSAAGGARLEKIRQINVHRIRVAPWALEQSKRSLARRPGVRFVERNSLFQPAIVPNDPSYSNQWHLPKIQAPQAWDISVGAPDLIIAILDSGVDLTHPDLASKLVPGYNFYDGNTSTADVIGHGTMVAGAAAAIGNNDAGVAGVAWQGQIMPIRVTNTDGWGSTSAIANGLTWAVDHGARVMNISFASVAGSATITAAAQYVRGKGGVVVAAAGNCGCVESTAENPHIISVSATDSSDNLASWSSRGNYVDVAAPGAGIRTTTNGGGYASVSGTSFSSPITAGVVALMMSANPALTPADLEALLEANADDRGAAGWDSSFGFGRINAYRAVAAAAASSPAPPPDTTPPDNVLSFSATAPSAGGRVDLSWTNPTSDFAGVLILRRAGAAVTEAPAPGLTYTVGQSIGSSTVIYTGGATGLADTSVVNGTTYHYRAVSFDAARNYASGVPASALPQAPTAACPAEIIVDNLAAGQTSALVSFTGQWKTSSGNSPYGGGSLYSSGAGLDTYTWKTPALSSTQSCSYEVSVWWTSYSQRSTKVPVTVTHAGGSTTRTFNQQTGGGQWVRHGTYSFAPATVGITQVSDAGGQAAADAVRFVLVPSPSEITIDNGAAGTSSTGSWCVSSASNAFGTDSRYSCGSGLDTYRWTPTLATSGTYQVYVWWTSHRQRSTAVPITVLHAGGATTRNFDQRSGGGQWVLYGQYTFNAGTAGYLQTSDANGQASADAVRFVPAP